MVGKYDWVMSIHYFDIEELDPFVVDASAVSVIIDWLQVLSSNCWYDQFFWHVQLREIDIASSYNSRYMRLDGSRELNIRWVFIAAYEFRRWDVASDVSLKRRRSAHSRFATSNMITRSLLNVFCLIVQRKRQIFSAQNHSSCILSSPYDFP